MPTRTIDTQIFEGEQIQCAKFVSDEPFSWKAAQIVQAECDYEFQMVAKSSVATSLKIQVGDSAKNQDITTEFTRFVIPFPSVTNDVDSLYITFPAGTYWLYNLQLERASTPSAWRPAPEDAEDYADKVAQQAVDDQTQLDVFNKLTNNGASQGIYLLDGQLYINGEYIAANTISGNKINGGVISGTEIDIGNGVFTVDDQGEVTASNLNMTGGSINLETDNQSYDFIRLLYAAWESLFRAQSFTTSYNNTLQNRKYQVVVHPLGISGYLDANQTLHGLDISMPSATGSSNSGGITIYDGDGKARVLITRSGISFYAENGTTNICKLSPPLTASSDAFATLQLNDGAGTRRVLLDATGLKFYNASGTLTKTYSAT